MYIYIYIYICLFVPTPLLTVPAVPWPRQPALPLVVDQAMRPYTDIFYDIIV